MLQDTDLVFVLFPQLLHHVLLALLALIVYTHFCVFSMADAVAVHAPQQVRCPSPLLIVQLLLRLSLPLFY